MLYALLTAVFFLTAPPVRADVDQLLSDVEAVNRARVCERAYRELGVGDRKVKMLEIRPNMKVDRIRRVTGFHGPNDIPNYDPKALYIGIANHEAGNHHYYVNIGDAHASRKEAFGQKLKSSGHIFFNGEVAEIKLPPEVAAPLYERAKAGKFGGQLSCLHAVCDLLEREGIVIHDRNGERRVRTKVVAANLVEGKIKIHGKDADPETIRLISTGPDELAHFLYKATVADARAERDMYIYAAAGTVVFVVVGGVTAKAIMKSMEPPEKKSKYRPLGTNDD